MQLLIVVGRLLSFGGLFVVIMGHAQHTGDAKLPHLPADHRLVLRSEQRHVPYHTYKQRTAMIDVFALFGIILMGVLPNQQKKTGSRFFALFKPRCLDQWPYWSICFVL